MPKEKMKFNLINKETLKINRSEVMKRAWFLFKRGGYDCVPNGFAKAIRKSWEAAKDLIFTITYNARQKLVKHSEGCHVNNNGTYCTKGT